MSQSFTKINGDQLIPQPLDVTDNLGSAPAVKMTQSRLDDSQDVFNWVEVWTDVGCCWLGDTLDSDVTCDTWLCPNDIVIKLSCEYKISPHAMISYQHVPLIIWWQLNICFS